MNRLLHPVRNERGATLVLFAALTLGLLSLGALAADVGMMFTVRSEAQRTAEAAALAGAGLYLSDFDPDSATVAARAREYATRNYVGNEFRSADTDSVQVDVLRAERRVRVTVRGVAPMMFARLIGVGEMPVSATAAAQVNNASAGRCLKPFAVPDAWFNYVEPDDYLVTNKTADEYYRRYEGDPEAVPAETGYGSTFRDDPSHPLYDPYVQHDWGRQVRLRAGNQSSAPGPSMYYSWDLPPDEEMDSKCGGGTGGSSDFQLNICNCNESLIVLGETYYTLTGAAAGWVGNGIDDLIAQDPNAWYDPVSGEVRDSDPKYGHWTRSPRVAAIALFDPTQLLTEGEFKSGKQPIVFNNFVSVFIENRPAGSNKDDIYGRMVPVTTGVAVDGGSLGSLVRIIQLVE